MSSVHSAKSRKRASQRITSRDSARRPEKMDTSHQSAQNLRRLAVLYFFSGIPALLYQTVWQRLLVLHSGVGSISVSIIVAAYMLGLGLGSLIGGHLSRGRTTRQLLWLFAGLEMMIAAYAFLSPTLMYDWLYRELGWLYDDMWTAAALHVLTLVLPTTLMGMTLPVLTGAVTRLTSIAPRGISTIYGCNALGAAAGALIAPWLLMPFVGVRGVCSLGAAINFLVALSALRINRNLRDTRIEPIANHLPVGNHQPVKATAPTGISFSVWLLLYFLSGFLAIGLEIVWFRILDVSVKSSALTFGTLLAVYLGCLAMGSLAGARRMEVDADPVRLYLRTQCSVVVLALVPVLLLSGLPGGMLRETWLFQYWAGSDPMKPGFSDWGATLVLYGCVPLFVMGASTFCMGYSFAALQSGVQYEANDSGYRLGVLQATNILGCVLGSLVVGLWWLGSFGTVLSLQVLSCLGALFALVGMFVTQSRQGFQWRMAAIICLIWLLPDSHALWLRLHGQSSDSDTVVQEDVSGIAAAVPIPDKNEWRISANGKSQSHLPFGGFHAKLGSLPTTLHPLPESIAIIGLGSGNTAWAAACRPESKLVRVFEVCTAELPLLQVLADGGKQPQLNDFLSDARLNIVGRDARHELMTTSETYDVIETDALRPTSAYAGYLYSQEFFELCRRRLKAGGLMCCWSPTPGTFSTFRNVFPHMLNLDNGYLLIGSSEPIELDTEAWKARLQAVSTYLGPEVTRECLSSIDTATKTAEQLDVPMINTDLFPFDEFQ